MKKLLSLLSVLTISGTAIPTTIAASPYQKEEQLNNNINNSENLIRNKRQIFNNVLFLNSGSLENKVVDEITNITVIKVLQHNTPSLSSVKAGSVYFGTTNGLYFVYKNSWELREITGVNGEVKKIEVDNQNNVYILNKEGKVFYLGYDQTEARTMDEIKYPVNDFVIFEKDINSNIKAGSVYFGTTNGVFFRYHNSENAVSSINLIKNCACDNNLENNVKKLFLDLDGNLYFNALSGNVYYVPINRWTPEKINKINNLNSMVFLKNDAANSNVKKGDIYFGTKNGVYYKSKNETNNDIKKVDQTDNSSVKLIELLPNGDSYSLDDNGNVYYIPFDSWEVKKVNDISDVNIIAAVQKDTFVNSVKKNSVYFGKNDGIYLKLNLYSNIQKIDGINISVKSIEISPNGSAFILG